MKLRDRLNISLTRVQLYRGCFLALCLISACCFLGSITVFGTASGGMTLFYDAFRDFLADLVNVTGYSAYGDPYNCTAYSGLSEKGYPPLTYVLLRPFARLVDIDSYYEENVFLRMYTEPAFLIFAILAMIALFIAFFEILRRASAGNTAQKLLTAALLLFSAPVVYTVERGNILILTAICVSFYLLNYDDANAVRRELALIALGFAFGLKLSPAVLGVLLLLDKRFWAAVRCAVYGLIFLFVPFLFLQGGLANVPLWLRNMKMTLAVYGSSSGCTVYACFDALGLDGLAKFFGGPVRCLICLLLLAACLLLADKWQRAACAVLVLLFAPSMSGYYCLIYMLPAMVLLLRKPAYTVGDWFAGAACFGMLCFPSVLPDYHFWLLLLTGTLLCQAGAALYARVGPKRAKKTRVQLSAKQRRTLIGVLGALAVLIAAGIRLVPYLHQQMRYRSAEKSIAAGSYAEALAGFRELGSFRDSAARSDECCERIYEQSMQQDPADAAQSLRAIPGYRDSDERLADLLDGAPQLTQAGDPVNFAGQLWRVLEADDSTLLLTALSDAGQRKFSDTGENSTWADSTLRKWLNGEWYASLPAEAQARIIPQQLKNEPNPTYGIDSGADTEDSVFLLSVQEYQKYSQVCDFNSQYAGAFLRSAGKEPGAVAFYINSDLYEMGGWSKDLEFLVYPSVRIRR